MHEQIESALRVLDQYKSGSLKGTAKVTVLPEGRGQGKPKMVGTVKDIIPINGVVNAMLESETASFQSSEENSEGKIETTNYQDRGVIVAAVFGNEDAVEILNREQEEAAKAKEEQEAREKAEAERRKQDRLKNKGKGKDKGTDRLNTVPVPAGDANLTNGQTAAN